MLALFANQIYFGLDQLISHVAVILAIQETSIPPITEAKTPVSLTAECPNYTPKVLLSLGSLQRMRLKNNLCL